MTSVEFNSIDVIVPTEVYGAGTWDGDLAVPTKDAVRDQIEALTAASGDITSIGDVTSGAAFDGTQGTTLTFNDTDGDQTLSYDTTNNKFVVSDNISVGSAGVDISTDGDGAITFLGLGDGSDEDLTLNLDDTSNVGTFTSSTALATLNFSSIALQESGIAVLNNDEIDGSSELLAIMDDETGTGVLTFATAPTFTTSIAIGSAGVLISDDGDGAITFLGQSAGADENLTFNFDDTANQVDVSTSTGVTSVEFNSIGLVVGGSVSVSPSGVQSLGAGTAISPDASYVRIQSTGGAVDLTVDPQVTATGTTGQMMVIVGQSETNTIKLDNGTGLRLSGGISFTMGNQDTLTLMFDGTNWVELSRVNNPST